MLSSPPPPTPATPHAEGALDVPNLPDLFLDKACPSHQSLQILGGSLHEVRTGTV